MEKIEKFLEKGDAEDVKDDERYDAFRELMNENNLPFEQDLYVISSHNIQKNKNSE